MHTKKLFVVYLEFTFNRMSYILSSNATQRHRNIILKPVLMWGGGTLSCKCPGSVLPGGSFFKFVHKLPGASYELKMTPS